MRTAIATLITDLSSMVLQLDASNKELLEALQECADDTQLDLRVAEKARTAIAKAKEQK
jgi:hypothetical protein